MDRPRLLRELGQIAQPVADLTRATAFYRNVLGLELLFEVPRMAFFELDGLRLMLARPEDGPERSGSILYFSVEDLDATHAALQDRGVTFEQGPTLIADMGDHELWMAFFRDTEGNQLALMAEVPSGTGEAARGPGPGSALT